MVGDAVRNYLALANGLVDVPRQQAMRAAKALVGQGEATAGQVGSLAEDLVTTSRGNRDVLVRLIGYEVDRALGRLGLATAEEVRTLSDRVRQLEQAQREASAMPRDTSAPKAPTGAAKAARPAKATRPAKTTKATKATKAAKATRAGTAGTPAKDAR